MNTDEGYEEEVDEELPSAMEETLVVSSPHQNNNNNNNKSPPLAMNVVKKEPTEGPTKSLEQQTLSPTTQSPLIKHAPIPPPKPFIVNPTLPVHVPLPVQGLKPPAAPFVPVGASMLPPNSMMLNQEGLLPMPSSLATKRVAVSLIHFKMIQIHKHIFDNTIVLT